MNHQTQVLDHLKQGKTLSQAEAINLFNCYRLSAVIQRLRRSGCDIVTHQEPNLNRDGYHARYELIGEFVA
ncbi:MULTISPECIES: helix-turn-helix domain-containing protein [Acinetobacter]|uniref:DNA-binding protein n=1 Tax=Acinetobacter piscicola TaxID=2006115 RepID=A0A7S6VZL2_9GAMM|nr:MULTISPECIES: helix-turn-helix domain-containing protein [Acinetobacter]QOW47787.1 DNA-binding protein [Acinetobacter piscicola]